MKFKRFSQLLVLVLVVALLSACGSKDGDKSEFTIGISQLAEQPALDDARLGFEEGLKELGLDANIVYKNAQGEVPDTLTIAQKFAKDEVDLIYTIGTSSAQSAKQATSDIPILFGAITDPVEADLVDSMESPGGNITGTSDEAPIDSQLQLFKDLDENISKIGIIYNTGEPNSEVQVNKVEELAPDMGFEIVPRGISDINDIPQAMDSIIKKVDGIYTITDNMVASAINIVSEKANDNNIITIGAEDAHVSGGILVSDSISYFELGKQTANMAKKILIDGKSPADIPAEKSRNTKIIFNEDTLKALEISEDNNIFKEAEKINK